MSRYLKQVIVVRKDLTMPAGKLAAMVAHASMTFLLKKLRPTIPDLCWDNQQRLGLNDARWDDAVRAAWECNQREMDKPDFSPEELRWLTELDPGIEASGQVSMAKIVCAVQDEAELLAVEKKAKDAGLECHRVIDSGYSHNKAGTFVCIAIGPAWPEALEPVTGGLKVYR